MKTQSHFGNIIFTGALALLLGAAGRTHAQPFGGGGGFGGFGGGGFGGFGQNRNTQSRTSSGQYNNNGNVGSASISVDPETHNIVVIADEETSQYIGQVITNLDRPKPQVLIKVVFLEVQHSDALDLGVEGGYTRKLNTTTNNPVTAVLGNSFGLGSAIGSATGSNAPAANLFGQAIQSYSAISPFGAAGAGLYQILGSDFQATLRAIAAAGKAQLLSRPSILARDGQPATIVVGQSVPLITGVNYIGTSGTAVNTVSYTEVGIILKVTPYVSADGYVQMILSPQISSVDPTQTQPIAAGVNAPVIDVRSADTVVVTPDKQTVVIGGLMENNKASSETKIPILGDIPLIGHLFKRSVDSNAKTELLIFLTPYIVQAPSQLAAVGAAEQSRMLAPKSYSEDELNRFLERVPVKKETPAKK